MRKYLQMLIMIIFIFVVSAKNVYAEKIIPAKDRVDANKIWTIKFNKEFDPSSIRYNITVTGGTGIVNVNIAAKDDKTIVITPPDGGYKADETYNLYISDSIKSKAGKRMNEGVRMQFTIKPENEVADELIKENESIVTIEALDENNKLINTGLGFVTNGKIVTNYSVIAKATSANIKYKDGTTSSVVGVAFFNKARDIAVMQTFSTKLKEALIGDSDKLLFDDNLYAVYYSGNMKNVSSGTMVNFISNNVVKDIIVKITGAPWEKNSIVFNGIGEVLGINGTDFSNNQTDFSYIIPINTIKQLMINESYKTLAQVKNEADPNTLPDGAVYDGSVIDGQADGYGRCTYTNGDKYIGQFKDNLFEGMGTFYWINGSVYSGNFKNGKMDGYGTYTAAGGAYRYAGQYKEGLKNGLGTLYAGSIVFDGVFENDNYIGKKPAAPTNVNAKAISANSIQVGWDEIADAKYYYVYYCDSNYGMYEAIKNSDGTKKKFYYYSKYPCLHMELSANSTYYYKVTAVKGEAESGFSNAAGATTFNN